MTAHKMPVTVSKPIISIHCSVTAIVFLRGTAPDTEKNSGHGEREPLGRSVIPIMISLQPHSR